MLVTRKTIVNDTELEVLQWSGDRKDEAALREFCGDQLHYVRDDGLAAVGIEPLITDVFIGKGDLLVKPVESAGRMLRLPGDVNWIRILFGSDVDA